MGYLRTKEFPDFSTYTPNLTNIVAHVNQLTALPLKKIKGLEKLEFFFLQNNQLTSIPDISFMQNLRTLQLKNNELTTVPDLFNLPLEKLWLSNNQFNCNQSLCWLRMWPLLKPAVLRDDPTCVSPPTLANQSIMAISPTVLECYKVKYTQCMR